MMELISKRGREGVTVATARNDFAASSVKIIEMLLLYEYFHNFPCRRFSTIISYRFGNVMKTIGPVFCELFFLELKIKYRAEISAVWQWQSAALSSSRMAHY